MLDVYRNYRSWFEEWGWKAYPNTTFEEHINYMTLYELLETLESWDV